MRVQLKTPSLEQRGSAGYSMARLWAAKLGRAPHWDIRMFGAQLGLAVILVAVTTVAIVLLVPVLDLRHVLAIYLVPVLAATLRWSFVVGLLTAPF